MNDQIMRLAKEAGFLDGDLELFPETIERFAELVRADEREANAKLCESMGVHPALNVWNGGSDWYKRQKECAAAIRQRGEK